MRLVVQDGTESQSKFPERPVLSPEHQVAPEGVPPVHEYTHAGQLPPQSTPVSRPFFIPSLQDGAVTHAGQLPPQSTPVSVPFLIPSLQVATTDDLEAEQDAVVPPLAEPTHCQLVVDPAAGKEALTEESVPAEQKVEPVGQAEVLDG